MCVHNKWQAYSRIFSTYYSVSICAENCCATISFKAILGRVFFEHYLEHELWCNVQVRFIILIV